MPFNPYMGGVNIDFVAKRKAILSSFFLLFGDYRKVLFVKKKTIF